MSAATGRLPGFPSWVEPSGRRGKPLFEREPVIHSYPWYIADWRNSETRLNLSLEERGLYRELLDFCYVERSLPADERKLARVALCSDEEFLRSWPNVRKLFNEVNGRYTNAKVSEVLGRLDGYHEQKRLAGVASGERRRNARSFSVDKNGNETRTPEGNPQNEPSHPIPSHPIPSVRESKSNTCPTDVGPVSDFALQPAPVNGNGKHPELHCAQEKWFEEWWAIYWRKVSRKTAKKAFFAKVKTLNRFEEVMRATKAQTSAMMAREPDHRPHGATWLNAERWKDEPSTPAVNGKPPGKQLTVVERTEAMWAERIARGESPL